MNFKLYRTKLKLSNLLNQQQQVNQASHLALVDQTSKQSIWFNRSSGDIQFKFNSQTNDLEELSQVNGYIGKFQINSNSSPKLIFIKQADPIGKLRAKSVEHIIYKVKKILIVSLVPGTTDDTNESLSTIECDLNVSVTTNNFDESLSSSLNDSTNESSMVSIRKSASSSALNELNNTSRFERKITDEIYKVFQDNDGSFYFSPTYDLTNSIERLEELNYTQFEWKNANDNFFWNKTLLNDLIEKALADSSFNSFILPLIQGFVKIESFDNLLPSIKRNNSDEISQIELRLCLISRRNRYRLG